jgi:hypothetical protein
MNVANTVDSFTGDIIAFLECGRADELRAMLRKRDDNKESTEEFLRSNLIAALCPAMLKTPALVQQIVGRALMRHVDWRAVAQWATVRPEDN